MSQEVDELIVTSSHEQLYGGFKRIDIEKDEKLNNRFFQEFKSMTENVAQLFFHFLFITIKSNNCTSKTYIFGIASSSF
jgi:hypothetical protein